MDTLGTAVGPSEVGHKIMLKMHRPTEQTTHPYPHTHTHFFFVLNQCFYSRINRYKF